MNITNLELTQATLEIFGGLVCLMSIVILTLNGYKRRSLAMIKRMFLIIAFLFFEEASAYVFGRNLDAFSIFMTMTSNFIVFALNFVLAGQMIRYLYILMEEKGIQTSAIYRRIADTCIGLAFFILIGNIFTNWMYYFDEYNCYHRNTGWYVYTALSLVCLITYLVMGIRYRKHFSRQMMLSILMYVLAPVIAIIYQALYYGLAITNMGIGLSMILMMVTYLKDWSHSENEEEEQREERNKTLNMVALFGVMVISLCASMGFCIVSIIEMAHENKESNGQTIAYMVSNGIENVLLRPIMVTETMAKEYTLHEIMKKSGESLVSRDEKEIAAYLDEIQHGFGYQMVYIVCEEDKAFYTSDGFCKYMDWEHEPRDTWYPRLMESGKKFDLYADTDEENQWDLSIFVNRKVLDRQGDVLGLCGIGVEIKKMQALLWQYEQKFGIRIQLYDRNGILQLSTKTDQIKKDSMSFSDWLEVKGNAFISYEAGEKKYMIRHIDELDWYLVIESVNVGNGQTWRTILTGVFIFLGGLVMMGVAFGVITKHEKRAMKELVEKKKMSVTDALTGLQNRRAFDEAIQQMQKNGTQDMCIVMMDINGLKTVNDTLGHNAGDEMIIGAADCMVNAWNSFGTIYRIGGDEFAALLKCSREEMEDAMKTFEHTTGNWKGKHVKELAVSVGGVVCGEHQGKSIEEMKDLADHNMYDAKERYYERTKHKRREK